MRRRWDASTMVRRVLDTQDGLIGTYFPRYAGAQNDLTKERYSRLVEKKPFDAIFNGEVSTLKKPYEDDSQNPDSNNNYYFAWGYQQEGDELFAISPDNIKYSMAMLIATSPTEETARLLQDINDFMLGDDDEDRIVVQIDWDKDATCSNTAINAQQSISSVLTVNMLNFMGGESVFQNTSLIPYLPFDIYKQSLRDKSLKSNNCQMCKKNKNDGCNCKKEDQPLAA